MGITELADLIRAGLDADEEAATEAGGTQFHLADYLWETKYLIVEGGAPGKQPKYTTEFAAELADHIVRHSPARVLAEVAGKRALLDEALGWEHHPGDRNPMGEPCPATHGGPCDCGRDARVLAILTHLAQPYQETT